MGSDHNAPETGEAAENTPTAAMPAPEDSPEQGLHFIYVPHPHIVRRKREGPVKVANMLPQQNPIVRFNSRLALLITIGVGSMWCAYLFAALAFVSFPAALKSGDVIILVAWISQTFFQLVLLPIIIVGQNIQGEAADKRAQQTYDDAEAVLHEALQIQEHLAAQDKHLHHQDQHLQRQDQRLREIVAALLKAYPAVTREISPPAE